MYPSILALTRQSLSRLLGLTMLAATLVAGRAQAQCLLYPIALSAQTVAVATPGTVLPNIWNGDQPGNFGWLTWTGDPGEPTLVDSLTAPGDSSTYVNPEDPSDHQLIAGKWVTGRPGVANGKHVRAALNTLLGTQIIVPVWDQVRGEGANAAYHISGFALVQLISYDLPSENRITALYLGPACGGVTL
ncbi:exported hypothetical protein [Verrucomicrobia bacterium]|nr:exported hypothetical protein [Verrucomicrobiota bacterium]